MLRIIAGEFRGRHLKTAGTAGTRPMTDRVRESLFSILAPELSGAHFLDLFAGSGAVGIEALSRGAAAAVFVEQDHECFSVINENLHSLGLGTRGIAIRLDAYQAVDRLGRSSQRYDIVFAGPPYDENHHNRILDAVTGSGICKDDGVIVLQYRKGDPITTPDGFAVATRDYGITSLSFMRRADA